MLLQGRDLRLLVDLDLKVVLRRHRRLFVRLRGGHLRKQKGDQKTSTEDCNDKSNSTYTLHIQSKVRVLDDGVLGLADILQLIIMDAGDEVGEGGGSFAWHGYV